MVAIIIANYNYGQWLEDAINSAINQDYDGKISIYVVESGSTDNSLEILSNKFFGGKIQKTSEVSGYKNSLSPTRDLYCISLPQNLGPSYARNIAIHEVIKSHQYVSILDSDDMMAKNKISKSLEVFDKYPEVGVVYGDYVIYDCELDHLKIEYKSIFSKELLHNECIVHSGSTIRSSVLEIVADENGYYDNNMRTCEDYDLWIRISNKYMIYHIPEVLTFVRNHKNNSTYTVDKKIWESNWLRIRQKYE